jgi:adenosylhomocysteine nucleosidase
MLPSTFARMTGVRATVDSFSQRRAIRAILVALVALLTACVTRDPTPSAGAAAGPRPVVVQGAMEVEVRRLASILTNATEHKVQAWTFWRGTIDGYPVIVSKTLKGLANAAAATSIAAELYQPLAIINQGTAGGHIADLKVFDIVVGIDSVNLGSFKTGFRPRGKGSEIGEWVPLDLMRSDGSAGNDPNARVMRRFHADERLLEAARRSQSSYQKGRVVEGVIGSSEVWNSEIDRIERFHDAFGTTVEEMETAAAAQIAGMFEIPFLGIRVVSNNITNGGTYDTKTAEACQDYVYNVVKQYLSGVR